MFVSPTHFVYLSSNLIISVLIFYSFFSPIASVSVSMHNVFVD